MSIWTFVIKNGEAMEIRLQGKIGPGHYHDGKVSIWKLSGTKAEAESTREMLESLGAEVKLYTEVEDEELRNIRFRGEF